MLPMDASKLLIVEGIEDDPLTRARAERMTPGVGADEVRHVTDEQLASIVREELSDRPRHGMDAAIRPVVIFNRFRFADGEPQRQRRIDAFPELNRHKLNGYGGFDWRRSGSAEYRRETGLVCQPAWQLHTIVGCHFRCAYCSLGHYVNIMMNMEEFVERLDPQLRRCPGQTLFQYDNFTDTVCFEPEYGGAKLLVDYFAGRDGQALELYVGKSDHVDFLLDLDHRGHTVCCWSLAGPTQSRRFEYLSATMEGRIEAMRKCQAAGYPVRVRFSPVIPVAGWREENRRMVRELLAAVEPDVITIETIRFMNHDALAAHFDLSLLDEEFVALMRGDLGREAVKGCEVPDAYRIAVYDVLFEELDRLAPKVPVAFCREARTLWDHYADFFSRRHQTPGRYICNCGPYSAPATV